MLSMTIRSCLYLGFLLVAKAKDEPLAGRWDLHASALFVQVPASSFPSIRDSRRLLAVTVQITVRPKLGPGDTRCTLRGCLLLL